MPNTVVALARSTHPGPTVAVTAIAVVLGIGAGLDPLRLALLAAMIFTNQLSVGLSNDWIDADRDRAVGRSDKPVARGLIGVSTVRTAAWASVVASVLVSLPLGAGTVITNAVFIASAWAYNAGLKNTVFSVVPYVVSFGLLPLIVTLARQPPTGAAWWAMAAGAALGIAAHFANVLPDLEDDERTGVRGLPHRMGRRGAGVATYLVLVAASALVVTGPGTPLGAVAAIGGTLSLIIAVAGIVLVFVRPPTRLLFQLIIAAALLDVVLLALAGSALLT
jgi:4-hydroxybenzoate polyprenyltransferase